jgi:hypothetical protein
MARSSSQHFGENKISQKQAKRKKEKKKRNKKRDENFQKKISSSPCNHYQRP